MATTVHGEAVTIFQEKLGRGSKGLHLPCILEARVFEKYLGIFVDYTCFFYEKRVQEN